MEEFVKMKSKDLPLGSREIIARIVECNHWAGEDAYDKERAAFIEKAVTKAKCASVDKDRSDLLKQNPKNIRLKKVLEGADKWMGSCDK